MNERVDRYIARSTMWPEELRAVRAILLRCGLEEDIKWGKPCFGADGHNIAILQEMKGFLSVMFFKGALLTDPVGHLVEQGPNSRSAKRMEFQSVADVKRLSKQLSAFVKESIELERAGVQVGPAPDLVLVDELASRLHADPDLRRAFAALTPGRRREYNLHISSAKQSATRLSRIESCVPFILAGKGLRDR